DDLGDFVSRLHSSDKPGDLVMPPDRRVPDRGLEALLRLALDRDLLFAQLGDDARLVAGLHLERHAVGPGTFLRDPAQRRARLDDAAGDLRIAHLHRLLADDAGLVV